MYAFGGLAEDTLTHSEKYHIDLNAWSQLPALREAKCAFTPCMLRSSLFLPEFRTCCALEEFSLAHEQSRLLLIDMGEIRGWAVTWVQDGDIVLVTSQGQHARWHPGMSSFVVNQVEMEGCSMQTCAKAVVWAEQVLWSEVTGMVVLDLKTMKAKGVCGEV